MARIEGYQVFARNWTESERGQGQRADGYSLHLSLEDADAFKKSHGMEGNAEEYSFPEWSVFRVIVDDALYGLLTKLKEEGRAGDRFIFPRTILPGQFVRSEEF